MSSEKANGISPKAILAAVVAVLALVFIFQNNDRGSIDVLFWSVSMPAWIWLLIVFGAGIAVGSLFPWLRPRKKPPAA